MLDSKHYVCTLCQPPKIRSLSNKSAHLFHVHNLQRIGKGKKRDLCPLIVDPQISIEKSPKNVQKEHEELKQIDSLKNIENVQENQENESEIRKVSEKLTEVISLLKNIESKALNSQANSFPPELLLTTLSQDLRRFNTWKKVEKEVRSTGILNGLKKRTIRQYLMVLNELRDNGFKPEELSNRQGYKRLMKWVIKLEKKAKNVYISAIRKAAKTCFPGAPLSFAKVKIPQSRKKWPNFDEAINKIKEMIKDKELLLAATSIFLIVTGLRIGEAMRLKLDDFGEELFVKDFVQEKSEKLRPFVIITKQFAEIARKIGWTKIPWKHSYLSEKLQKYKISCHGFRHIFVTRRTQWFGKGLKSTSEAIGHSSTKITQIYMIDDLEQEKELINTCFNFDFDF